LIQINKADITAADNSLVNIVLDQFGSDIFMVASESGYFSIKTDISISLFFWMDVLTWPGSAYKWAGEADYSYAEANFRKL